MRDAGGVPQRIGKQLKVLEAVADPLLADFEVGIAGGSAIVNQVVIHS